MGFRFAQPSYKSGLQVLAPTFRPVLKDARSALRWEGLAWIADARSSAATACRVAFAHKIGKRGKSGGGQGA
jgi:hypothetical protein